VCSEDAGRRRPHVGADRQRLELSVQAWSKSEDAGSLRADLIRNALLIVQEVTAPVKSEAEKQGA
jgi:hypothetical protein